MEVPRRTKDNGITGIVYRIGKHSHTACPQPTCKLHYGEEQVDQECRTQGGGASVYRTCVGVPGVPVVCMRTAHGAKVTVYLSFIRRTCRITLNKMCGRYVLVQKVEVLEKRFGVKAPPGLQFEANVNIGIGDLAPVITDAAPTQLDLFTFGLTPFWAKKPMYLFNARSEGDRNAENDTRYTGGLDIINKPAFRKAIRSQRCLIPADAFIEGTTKEKLARPYLAFLTDREPPFAFAGIWDHWVDKESGKTIRGFSIITTVTNSVLAQLPHHRSPVILLPEQERAWLDPELPLAEVLSMLRPYPADGMNAFPIDPAIRTPGSNNPAHLAAHGPAVRTEVELRHSLELVLQGMGSSKRNAR